LHVVFDAVRTLYATKREEETRSFGVGGLEPHVAGPLAARRRPPKNKEQNGVRTSFHMWNELHGIE
jgi:hypothetical protein